ncbi:DNA packaging FI family protein [Escherichia coli 2850400]|nr:DNA packaging FI family protein [Escherichia coli 2850400]
MTKDELIARLQVLGEQLNRDVSLTGTKEELVLRVAELEEELDDTDDAAGQDTSVSPENALTGHENEVVSAQPDTVIDTAALVTVVALVTLHTDALHATRDTCGICAAGNGVSCLCRCGSRNDRTGLARMQ